MKKMKVIFFDAKEYDIESFDKIKETRVSYHYIESKLDKTTVALAKGYDAVCVFVNDVVDKLVIKKLSEYKIKAILLRCAGFNNVDMKAAAKYNIPVLRVEAYSPYAVAEHAFALLQTINRRTHKAYIRTRNFNFSIVGLTGVDLHGKTIGIIGTGKIGTIMIKIAKGYGMKVIAYDPFPNPYLGVDYVSKEELFKESDIISLHCPLSDSTKNIIDSNAISMMKKGVIIVNTSRGGLINSTDLYNGLYSRKIGAACLDVYEEEGDIFFTNQSDHILNDQVLSLLIALPNVIVTSHQGFLTKEALAGIASKTTENALSVLK